MLGEIATGQYYAGETLSARISRIADNRAVDLGKFFCWY